MKIDLKELKESYHIKSIKQINIDKLPTLLIGETEEQTIYGFAPPYKKPCLKIAKDSIYINNTLGSRYFSHFFDIKSRTSEQGLEISIFDIEIMFPTPNINISKKDIVDMQTGESLSYFLNIGG